MAGPREDAGEGGTPVPGAWELPLAARELADTGRYDGVIALGAVVRGETAHFDFISAECARGLQQTMLETGVPTGFGVLTPENAEQAIERADPNRRNKGREAALAVLDMIDFRRRVRA
ncbi:MAG TPA: 6,7-dimethyl-8-ribityllumazine synthase [Wenzhouxiangella sp.]|nr:6,7-dimethyl-8-ribityllumazine synthase [Wenzhouxiangella sp.]